VMMMVPMSDVPVAAAWTIALWCLLGDSTASAIGAGVATAVAILIRPNLVPMAVPMGLWYLVKAWRGGPHDRKSLLGFVGGALPGACAIAVIAIIANRAKPMDNTDMDLYWRKEVADDFAGYALRELRGDDMRETRLRIARFAV